MFALCFIPCMYINRICVLIYPFKFLVFLKIIFLTCYHSILCSFTLMYDIVYYSIILIITYIAIILTGWTVGIEKLSQINSIYVLLFDLLNTTRCGELLFMVKNTYPTAWDSCLDNVRMSIYHPLFMYITLTPFL